MATDTEDPPLFEAQRLVDRFTEFFQEVIMASSTEINIVWETNIMFLAASFVETYRSFRDSSKPHQVLLAYHYTDGVNLESIERNGLLSKPERDRMGVESKKYNGQAYGPGIYCCHDPVSTSSYGDTALLLAILPGRVFYKERNVYNTTTTTIKRTLQDMDGTTATAATITQANSDTIFVGTSLEKKNSWSIVKTAEPVLPLVLLPKKFATHPDNQKTLQKFHLGLQQLLDDFFNAEPAPVSEEWFKFGPSPPAPPPPAPPQHLRPPPPPSQQQQ